MSEAGKDQQAALTNVQRGALAYQARKGDADTKAEAKAALAQDDATHRQPNPDDGGDE